MLQVVANKLLTPIRNAWHRISSFQIHYEVEKSPFVDVIIEYKKRIRDDLLKNCDIFKALIEGLLGKQLPIPKMVPFLYKLRGDIYRYECEVVDTERVKETAELALKQYIMSAEAAKRLFPADPLRLEIALNFSVFYYEVLSCTEKACEIAKIAYDDAVGCFNSPEDVIGNKESLLIMQRMRDYMAAWSFKLKADSKYPLNSYVTI